MISYQRTIFSFDFDNTISRDPKGFLKVMALLDQLGHVVYVVTGRSPDMNPEDLHFIEKQGYQVFFTSFKAKRKYMEDQGIKIDVWVDDSPEIILKDYKGKPYTYRDIK